MARRIIISDAGDKPRLLTETTADNEAELQRLLKENPDLLPLEELGLSGTLLVVGEETTLPSGAVDLLAITRGGHLLIIELKTGPDNSDFRRALAQLLDYGSDLWGMSLGEFENAVALRYFHGDRCRDARMSKVDSLDEAATAFWSDLSDEEWAESKQRLGRSLEKGEFHYVLAAQRFSPPTERTLMYLNQAMTGSSLYAIEMVRFEGGDTVAFETRTLVKPEGPRIPEPPKPGFLEQFSDDSYREAVTDFIDGCIGLGMRVEWGAVGPSIRIKTQYRVEPLSIAWLFPPSKRGWMGLTDMTVGFDQSSVKNVPEVVADFEWFAAEIGKINGAEQESRSTLSAHHFAPSVFQSNVTTLIDAVANLASRIGD